MKLLKLVLLEPRDCFGKKPDGRKTLIKETTRDSPAIYVTSELEAYSNLIVVEINGINYSFELFVTPLMVEAEGSDIAALHILRELSHQVTEAAQQQFNKQINTYLKEHPNAPC